MASRSVLRPRPVPEPALFLALPYRGLVLRRWLWATAVAEVVLAATLGRLHPGVWAGLGGAILVAGAAGVGRLARARIELRRDEMVVHGVLTTRLERWRVEGFVADAYYGTLGTTLAIVAKVNTGMDTPVLRVANPLGRRRAQLQACVDLLNAWVDPAVRAADPSPEQHLGAWLARIAERLGPRAGPPGAAPGSSPG